MEDIHKRPVTEPDPCVTPNTYTTSYTYDWMKNLTGVSMPRANVSYSGTVCSETSGSTTQTRTFVYDSAGQQASATNPENGTVTYTYNTENTLQKKHDAKAQDTVYTYNTNPVSWTLSQYSYGRATTAQYGCPVIQIIGGSSTGYTCPSSYFDMAITLIRRRAAAEARTCRSRRTPTFVVSPAT
jgi:YD repeat-containing protein